MWNKIFGICLLLAVLMACTLEEAKAPKHSSITVYTDQFIPSDSSFIREFEEFSHIRVNVIYKESSALKSIIRGSKYNTGFDVIITKSDTLRQLLKDRNMLYKISNARLFRNLNRQFNNNHYLWLPICHNPLILEVKLDSITSCSNLNWLKIFKDSTAVVQKIDANELLFYNSLKKANSRYELLLKSKNYPFSQRLLIKLDDYIAFKSKNSNKYNSCAHILNEHQRFFTTFTSISINNYARNKAEAIRFLDYYGKFSYQIASNRSQMSTFNGIITNYQISELNLNQ